jgi:prepilin-type N-terminal cleavage/methylation domain-containing protein
MTHLSRRRLGFTLLELLIAIVIVGILAALAIAKFADVKRKVYIDAEMNDLHNYAVFQEHQSDKFGAYIDTTLARENGFAFSDDVLPDSQSLGADWWYLRTRHRKTDVKCHLFMSVTRENTENRILCVNGDGSPIGGPPFVFATFSAKPNPVGVTQPVAFDASKSVPATATFAWTFGDGATATGGSATHSYATAGDYTAKLVVKQDGAYDSTTTTVHVVSGPTPPSTPDTVVGSFQVGGGTPAASFSTVALSPTALPPVFVGRAASVMAGPVTLAAAASGDQTFGLSNIESPTYASIVAGRHVWRSSDAHTWWADSTLTLDATSSFAAKSDASLRYRWDFGFASQPTVGPRLRITLSGGDVPVRLIVSDGEVADTVVRTIHLLRANRPPIADFGISVTPSDPHDGVVWIPVGNDCLNVTLDGRLSRDPDGDVLTHTWVFNNSISALASSHAAPVVTLTCVKEGDWRHRLTVTDPHGATSTVEKVMRVRYTIVLGRTNPACVNNCTVTTHYGTGATDGQQTNVEVDAPPNTPVSQSFLDGSSGYRRTFHRSGQMIWIGGIQCPNYTPPAPPPGVGGPEASATPIDRATAGSIGGMGGGGGGCGNGKAGIYYDYNWPSPTFPPCDGCGSALPPLTGGGAGDTAVVANLTASVATHIDVKYFTFYGDVSGGSITDETIVSTTSYTLGGRACPYQQGHFVPDGQVDRFGRAYGTWHGMHMLCTLVVRIDASGSHGPGTLTYAFNGGPPTANPTSLSYYPIDRVGVVGGNVTVFSSVGNTRSATAAVSVALP